MIEVSVQALNDHLQGYLERAREGERVVVIEGGKPIAVLSAADAPAQVSPEGGWRLVRRGLATWDGGKPRGAERPVRSRGPNVSSLVVEDRR